MRRKILIITVLLLAITILFTVVNTVKAASTESAESDSVVKVEDSNGTKYYNNLNEALTATQTGATVTLLDNVEVSAYLPLKVNMTFDFNGNTINAASDLAANNPVMGILSNATVTLKGNGGITNKFGGAAILITGSSKVVINGGTYISTGTSTVNNGFPPITCNNNSTLEVNAGVTVKNEHGIGALLLQSSSSATLNGGTFTQTGTPKDGKNYSVIECDTSTLNVNKGTIITSKEGLGIFAAGTSPKVTVNGGTINTKSFAISGNGSTTTNSTITINGGNLTSTGTAAIYHPESGDLIVNGGTITGYFGIVSRQGTINVKGGDITAKGTEPREVGDAGVVLPVGAVVTDNNSSSYVADTKVTITNGNFTGSIVEYNNEAKDDITVTGGSFDRKLDEAYVKESLEVKKGDKYYLGDNAENVITEAKSGETLTILNGSADLKNIHNGVKVSNEGSGNVILNGQKVEKTQVEIINQTEQLADLKKQLADLKTKLEDEKVNLEQVRKELNELKDRVNSLEGDNKDLKDEIANLEAKLEKLEAEQNTSTQTTPETQKPNDETANEPTDETTDGNDVVNNKPTGELDDEPKTGDTYAISAGLVSLLSLVGAIVSKRFIK